MNEERAAQFAPFASLRGFYGMIDEEEQTTLTPPDKPTAEDASASGDDAREKA